MAGERPDCDEEIVAVGVLRAKILTPTAPASPALPLCCCVGLSYSVSAKRKTGEGDAFFGSGERKNCCFLLNNLGLENCALRLRLDVGHRNLFLIFSPTNPGNAQGTPSLDLRVVPVNWIVQPQQHIWRAGDAGCLTQRHGKQALWG